jgi:hypothetical protein
VAKRSTEVFGAVLWYADAMTTLIAAKADAVA